MTFLVFKLSDGVFIMLINVKMSTIVDILILMSMINFMLSWVEHEKCFITSWHGVCKVHTLLIVTETTAFYRIWGLQPFWSSDLKQTNEYSIKQSRDIWETNVYIGMWQSKWVALDKRSQVSLTFGTYIKPLSHNVKHFSKVLWFPLKQS